MVTKATRRQSPRSGGTVAGTMGRPPADPDLSTYKGQRGAHLRTLRVARFERGADAANAMTEAGYDCSPESWLHWEGGRRSPDDEALPYMARILGVEIADLFPPFKRKRS